MAYQKYTSTGAEHAGGSALYAPDALKWDLTNEHYYETGVKEAVIYLKERTPGSTLFANATPWKYKIDTTATVLDQTCTLDANTQYWGGVAWNGLISCTQTPDGADTEDLYANNEKYLSLRAKEDFGGSLSAYTYPDVWAECDGTAIKQSSTAGFIRVHGQTRKAFGLSYVTQEGNDTSFQDFAQKIHIIYEATASPTDREYSTINDSPEAIEMSWDFKTTPIDMTAIDSSLTKSSYIEILQKEVSNKAWTVLKQALHGWGTKTQDAQILTDYCTAFLPPPAWLVKIAALTDAT